MKQERGWKLLAVSGRAREHEMLSINTAMEQRGKQ